MRVPNVMGRRSEGQPRANHQRRGHRCLVCNRVREVQSDIRGKCARHHASVSPGIEDPPSKGIKSGRLGLKHCVVSAQNDSTETH